MKPKPLKATPKAKARQAPPRRPAKPSPPAPAARGSEEMKFRAQDALHTLKRAHEIQQDPHLMAHVQTHAQRERDILKKIARKR